MNCEFCRRPIGAAGTQDYCVVCSRNLCRSCLASSCKDSPSGKHEPWSEINDEPLAIDPQDAALFNDEVAT